MPAALDRYEFIRDGFLQRRECPATVPTRDRFLDLAHEAAHFRTAALVDYGAPRDLAGRLAVQRAQCVLRGLQLARRRFAAQLRTARISDHNQVQDSAPIIRPRPGLTAPRLS